MPHGFHIQELESVAAERKYVFGNESLGELIRQVKFSKLSEYSFSERGQFYSELLDQLKPDPERKIVGGMYELRETDALHIVTEMSANAKSKKLSKKLR